MCDVLTTADGAELTSCADARAYGLDIPTTAQTRDVDCLCNVNLDTVLAATGHEWRWSPFGFDEVGADGRTWADGFDIVRRRGRYVERSRSDDRRPVDVTTIVAASAARAATAGGD